MARGQRKKRAYSQKNCQKKNKLSVKKKDYERKTRKLSAVIPRDEEQPSTSGLKETRQHKRKMSPDWVCSLSKRQVNARKKPCSSCECDFQCHQNIKQVATSSFNLSKKIPVKSIPNEVPVAKPQRHFLRRRKTLVTAKEDHKTVGNSKTVKKTKPKEQLNAVVRRRKTLVAAKEGHKTIGNSKTSKNKEQLNAVAQKKQTKNIKNQPEVKLKVNPLNEPSSSKQSTSTNDSNDLPSVLNLKEYLGYSMLVEPHEKRLNGHFFNKFPKKIKITRAHINKMINLALRRVNEEKNMAVDCTTSNIAVDSTTSKMDFDSTTSNKLNYNSSSEYSDSSSDPSSDTDDENIATGLFKFRKQQSIAKKGRKKKDQNLTEFDFENYDRESLVVEYTAERYKITTPVKFLKQPLIEPPPKVPIVGKRLLRLFSNENLLYLDEEFRFKLH